MSEIIGICIPPKTPPVSKAQLKIDLAKFTERNEHLEWDSSADIQLWKEQNVTELLLDCIAAHKLLSGKEMSRLIDIAQKVARSKDFIVCSCEVVRELIATPLPRLEDPLIIDFIHSSSINNHGHLQ